jgi:bifunctional NMN adenylyltransferase/nudix hydrolase
MSGCAIRRAYFDEDARAVDAFLRGPARDQLPPATASWLETFRRSADYADLVGEQAFADRYRAAWSAAPYPPVFVTADAMVACGDRVLVIRRKARPGQGLWALPGGFLEQDEFIVEAAMRELEEETGLSVDRETLRRCAVATRVFDAPWRDIRGRMVTHATLFRLTDAGGSPPAVQGGDDAAEAAWVPLASLRRETLFGDHFQVVQTLLAAERELGGE